MVVKFVKKVLDIIFGRVLILICRIRGGSIDPHKIVFFTFQGEYTCNPKYISQELIKRGDDIRQVWVTFKEPRSVCNCFPKNALVVRFNSIDYYKEVSTAGILIDNAFNFQKSPIRKRKGQKYIETMHGSLGIKKIGPDVVKDWRRNRRGFNCGRMTDYALSNSSFETMVYETSFWNRKNIVELGHARNDVFFRNEDFVATVKNKVRCYFGINEKARIVLYAPTRPLNSENTTAFEEIDFESLIKALSERFEGEWIVLDRRHHAVVKKAGIKRSAENVYDADGYPDIQELMIGADFGITDYSSWIFDYLLQYKPGMLFVPDVDEYSLNRGFYYPIEEVPYPICRSNTELAEKILSYNEPAIKNSIGEFLKRRGCIDDGHASERIADLIENIIDEMNHNSLLQDRRPKV